MLIVSLFSSHHDTLHVKAGGTYVIRWVTVFPLESTLGVKDIKKY